MPGRSVIYQVLMCLGDKLNEDLDMAQSQVPGSLSYNQVFLGKKARELTPFIARNCALGKVR